MGAIGDGTLVDPQPTPTAVAGGHAFIALTSSSGNACGQTISNEVYCWGFNGNGELGDGTLEFRRSPTRVSGGLMFVEVAAGGGSQLRPGNLGGGLLPGPQQFRPIG